MGKIADVQRRKHQLGELQLDHKARMAELQVRRQETEARRAESEAQKRASKLSLIYCCSNFSLAENVAMLTKSLMFFEATALVANEKSIMKTCLHILPHKDNKCFNFFLFLFPTVHPTHASNSSLVGNVFLNILQSVHSLS